MFNLPNLSPILDTFQTTNVRITPERCLNRRHKDSNCALCLACPKQAVAASGMAVAVQAEACVGCGLCIAVCPTEVFAVDGPRLPVLLRQVADWQDAIVEIACPQRSPLEETRSNAAVVLRLPCLAWLSSSLLVALLAQKPSALWLDDTACAQCSLGSVHDAIVDAVAGANKLLTLVNRPPAVFLYSANEGRLRAPRRVQVMDPRQPSYSRRDFFGALRRAATETAAGLAEQTLPTTSIAKLAPHLPTHRALLAVALPHLGRPHDGVADTTGLPLAQVKVNAACTACGLCAKMCPAGALDLRQDETSFVLDYQPLHCLGEACRVCRLICPLQAVTLSPQANLAEIIQGHPQILRAGTLTGCVKCGAPTAQTDGEALCHACQWVSRLANRGHDPTFTP